MIMLHIRLCFLELLSCLKQPERQVALLSPSMIDQSAASNSGDFNHQHQPQNQLRQRPSFDNQFAIKPSFKRSSSIQQPSNRHWPSLTVFMVSSCPLLSPVLNLGHHYQRPWIIIDHHWSTSTITINDSWPSLTMSSPSLTMESSLTTNQLEFDHYKQSVNPYLLPIAMTFSHFWPLINHCQPLFTVINPWY